MAVDLFIYASGWRYDNPSTEDTLAQKGRKQVTSRDFHAAAIHSAATVVGVSSIAEFVDALSRELSGKQLGRLQVMGHGANDPGIGAVLGFRGTIPNDPSAPAIIDPSTAYSVHALQRNAQPIRDALAGGVASGAVVRLYACSAGLTGEKGSLLETTAAVFGVPTYGFKGEIQVCSNPPGKDGKFGDASLGWFVYGKPKRRSDVKGPANCQALGFTQDLTTLRSDASAEPAERARHIGPFDQ